MKNLLISPGVFYLTHYAVKCIYWLRLLLFVSHLTCK